MKSLWQATATRPKFEKLKRDIKTDVLVIGGGIAGILTAYMLKEQGVDCILVEQDRILSGVTHNTTAKITYQHGLIYHKIEKSAGLESARLYLEANRKAFDEYQKLCQTIQCDYTIKNNYVYTVDQPKKLEKEMATLERMGFDAQFCQALPLPIQTAGAVCFQNQAEFHPLKFLSELAKRLTIYEYTHVKEMIGNTAITNEARITANRVIVATHFPFINKHGSYFLKLYQHRSYVLALDKAQDVGGMYVDDDKKGLSFRNYENLLLLGGGSHHTGKKGGNWDELRCFTKQHYPNAKERYVFATQDCMSLDSIPYIGKYSKRTQELYVATGFNKWGMTSAMVAAQLLTDLVMGRKNDYETLFSPSRSILKPQLAINSIESILNLLTPTTKRCPHLGCALKWNPAEHSWDCPCHGSRFTRGGKRLDNPANENMDV